MFVKNFALFSPSLPVLALVFPIALCVTGAENEFAMFRVFSNILLFLLLDPCQLSTERRELCPLRGGDGFVGFWRGTIK
jgi:hypothetical protein